MLVSRNPFSRSEVHRQLVPVYSRTCDWCGSVRTYRGKPTDKLYAYSVESDGGSRGSIRGFFCSASCFSSYHLS